MIRKITFATILLCFAISKTNGQSLFTGKPTYQIYTTMAGTPLGNITIELFPAIAPQHARNFDSLVSTGFYDTIAFHRVIPGFMIQGGDPNSRHGPANTWGYGQPGQPTVNAEFSVLKHLRGILSAARSANINSATSQFFICVASASHLDGNYSIYGRVLSGMNIVDTIVNTPRNAQDCPLQKIEMFVTYLNSNDSVPDVPILTAPPTDTVGLDSLTVNQLKWNAVNGALLYHLDVSTDSLFVADTVRSVNQLTTSYNISNLKGNTKYYWRVKANNGGNISTSAVWNFHTETTGVNTYTINNKNVMLFPNPNTGKFTISGLDKGNTIRIFDVTGKLVYDAISKDTSVVVDLEGLNKGIYIYQIKSGGKEVQHRKLVVR